MVTELPRLQPVSLIERWAFHNGLLSGLIEYDGARYAAQIADECDPFADDERWYIVYSAYRFVGVWTPQGMQQRLRPIGDPIGWCKEQDLKAGTP
jgi:hypothetical protein